MRISSLLEFRRLVLLDFSTEAFPKRVGSWYVRYGSEAPLSNSKCISVLATSLGYSLTLVHDTGASVPYTSSDKSIAVVFQGELNEFLHETDNPASAVREGYKRYSEEVFQKIGGTYFLLLWDLESECFYAVRDRLAIVPLFYSRVGDTLYFSTSLESLTQATGDSTVDRLQLAQHLTGQWVDPDRTYYRAIQRLPARTLLRYRRGREERVTYWHRPTERLPEATPEEVEQFFPTLERAVERAIGRHRPGIFLSGGLDSISVAAVMAKLSVRPTALSLTFPHPDMDESHTQKEVARTLGFPIILLSQEKALHRSSALEAYLEMTYNWPSPILSFWYPSFYALALKGREAGCRVILTGGGGDEWLGVGVGIAEDLLRGLHFKKLYDFWRATHSSFASSTWFDFRLVFWTFGLRSLLSTLVKEQLYRVAPESFLRMTRGRMHKYLPDWVVPDKQLRDELLDRMVDNYKHKINLYTHLQSRYLLDSQLYFEHPLSSLEHEQVYEMGERTGVCIKAPYMDSDLVDLLRRTPPEILNRQGRLKGLIRGMMREYFPQLNLQNQKKLITTRFYQSLLQQQIPNILKSFEPLKKLCDLGLVDSKRLGMYKERVSPDLELLYSLREVLNLESWLSRSGRL